MAFEKVPAGNGVQWITESVNLIMKNPAPFLLMGLVIGVISIVPFLGQLALLVLGPALYGGIMYAAREEQSGRKADLQHLFQAFKEPGKLPKMLFLCLPTVAAAIIVGVLAVMMLGGALLGIGAASNDSAAGLAAAGAGILVVLVIGLAVGLVVFALTFFATPRVMLEDAEPIDAMKDSARAVLANIGPVIVYVVILIVAFLILGVILSLIPFIGPLLLTVAITPLVSVAAYIAWRQVYRHDITREIPPAQPPVPPPSVEV